MSSLRLFLLLTLALACPTHPAFSETLEQAKAAFTAADKTLNSVYQKAKAGLPEHVFDEVQEEQREWLGYRDSRALAAAVFDGGAAEGEEKSNLEYWKALTELTADRVRILEGWMKWDSFSHEWEGVWADGSGGRLLILEKEPGSFAFSIEVVRGPTYHLGNLSGTAEWNGGTARFSIDPGDGEAETWLTFVKRNYKLEIIGENTMPYHGARAYFDGEYLRISELSEEDRRQVLSPPEP
jgi:uncharacterized protein YecT (DUF1311 family)